MVLLDRIEGINFPEVKVYFVNTIGGLGVFKIMPFDKSSNPVNKHIKEFTTMQAAKTYLRSL